MEEERDLVVFSDDEGNEFELEIVDYFDYEGQEYAVLVDPESGCSCGCGCECDDEECEGEHEHAHEHGAEVYIMKIVVNGEYEEFLPADEDKMEALSKIVEERFEEMDDEECGCGCGCGCEECGDEAKEEKE